MHSVMCVPLLLAIFLSSVVAQSAGHPKFEPPTEQIVLQEGSLEIVECVAAGDLPLRYTWYNQNDAEIGSDANEDVFTRRSQNGSSLVFAGVEHSHAGLYSCSATNRHGTALKPYDVIVNTTSGNNITANDTAEIVSVKVLSVTENSVEFVVLTRDDPDSFYIRFKEQLDKEEGYVQIKRGEKAVVKDLVPAGRYEFKFQLEPPYEVKSYYATPYYVTLLPGVPDVIFRNIRDGSVEVEWFRSVDDTYRETIEEYELSYNTIYQVGGRYWDANKCVVTIKIPNKDCSLEARYTIAGLQSGVYYEIRLRVRTSTGFGKPYVIKVHT